MGTFAYAPAIRVLVESETQGIIDVSGDITNWNLDRRSNTVSSFNFTLQNTQRKYDGLFWPGDRITVELKRIVWCRVFTGTLNNSPVFSAWPRALPMSASCSLKKLQFWPWDPTTEAAYAMITKWLPVNNINSTTKGDQGLSNLIVDSLSHVTNWDSKAIHIGEVPNAWFAWAQNIEKNIDMKASMASVLGDSAIIGGVSTANSIKLPSGFLPGFTDAQLNTAVVIYSNILQYSGLSTPALQDRAAQIALMTALTESTLQNLNHGDRDSVGIFQQRPSEGWGSAAEIEDATLVYPVKAFLGLTGRPNAPTGLLQITGWQNMDPGAAAQAVQVSGPNAYNAWVSQAQQIVAECRKQLTTKTAAGISNGATIAGLPNDIANTPVLSTGPNLATVAANLILSRPPGSIAYSQERGTAASDPHSAAPTRLDCSSLVSWCFYHATGQDLNKGNADAQWQFCKAEQISLDAAQNIQGALLFNVVNGYAEHVGISLGNGFHVAAHTDGIPLDEQVNISSINTNGGFNTAALLPNLDYSNAGTTSAAIAVIKSVTGKPANQAQGQISITSTNPGATAVAGTGSSTDPFQALLKIATVVPSLSGNIFGGPRKLINNQPFLPWLKNIVNSSMRAFCSAPNGDFMAWFPDYFDITGTCAKMVVHPIELQDFTVDWSDQQIVTHEFVTGSLVSGFDQASGSVVQVDNGYTGIYQMLLTNGIATMDDGDIFRTLYGHPASQQFLQSYLERFGARPNVDSMPNIQHGQMEFCMALWNFMYYWSAQFSATIPMTFMPELWPGMIIQIPEYNFQAYVTEVNHQGSFGSGGQFTTTAQVIAPALIDQSQRSSMFGMFANILPASGQKM